MRKYVLIDTQVPQSFPALEDVERHKLVDIGTTDVSVKEQELWYVRVGDGGKYIVFSTILNVV